ncbi:MAG: hypothetical protein ABII12_05735 [Planctomycetota bacterium]
MTVLLALMTVANVLGQTGESLGRPFGKLTEQPYVDGTFGFSISPPEGWLLNNERAAAGRNTTLLRMTYQLAAGREQGISVQQMLMVDEIPMSEMVQRISHAMELESSNVKILSQQTQRIAGRPGAVLTAAFWQGGFEHLRLQAVVEASPRTYFILVYTGPVELRADIEPLFHLVLGSFRLLGGQLGEKEMKAALSAGATWLATLDEGKLRQALVPQQFLQVRLDDRVVGVVSIQQEAYTRERRVGKHVQREPGIRIRERGWTFHEDGRAVRTQTAMFVSSDLLTERWKTSVTTLLPADGAMPPRLENTWEEGLRSGDVLLTSQARSLGEPPKQNEAIRVPKTYISRLFVRLLPRLLDDLAKPRHLAFTTFDHQRTDLIVRVVELKGQDTRPDRRFGGKAYRIDEREGSAGEPSSLFFDETGRLLMIRTGNLTMLSSDRDDLERQFADRIAEAEEEMARLEAAYEQDQQRFRKRPPSGRDAAE